MDKTTMTRRTSSKRLADAALAATASLAADRKRFGNYWAS
jgi:hypothetical protein